MLHFVKQYLKAKQVNIFSSLKTYRLFSKFSLEGYATIFFLPTIMDSRFSFSINFSNLSMLNNNGHDDDEEIEIDKFKQFKS